MKAISFFPAMAVALTLSLSSVQAATDVYAVTGVQIGQFLNMRSDVGTSSAITARIPANGQGVVTTGEQRKINGTTWAKVYWNGIGGWVNKSYLSPANQRTTVTAPAKPAKPVVATKPQTTATSQAKPIMAVMAPYKVTAPPMMPSVKVPSYMTPPKPLNQQ
ncbi:SH3 domain-containing protein [Thiothrix lacustris]|uniref:SH3 domain-containing protein n=1 Tax=Thiothrix lacustris TaxID=525917 RepID=A0ABY9MPC5_9GAMM|nr:SH3 domain-containing protein [Thiothrix lacustris]WML90499.1 SH3 domain-containing protein [Thiothrix lacustris]WMP17841.1 SH3 domain-containing protein [Thiothrix lacustris]